jgi:hypothetical protein
MAEANNTKAVRVRDLPARLLHRIAAASIVASVATARTARRLNS